MDHVADLGEVKIPAVHVRIDRDAPGLEGFREKSGVPGGVAHQDHDVAEAEGPQLPVVPDLGLARQAQDVPGHGLRLGPRRPGQADRLAGLRVDLLQQVDFRRGPGLGVRAGLQHGLLVIVDFGDGSAHDLREHVVHRGQDVLVRPEIVLKQDFPLRRVFRKGKIPVLAQEQGGVRLAEGVDALLDVAHEEEGVVFVHGLNDALLDCGNVLILVHEDRVKAPGDRLADRLAAQGLQTEMLQVAVIEEVLFALVGLIALLHLPEGLHQAPDDQQDIPAVRQGLVLISWQQADGLLCGGLEAVPGGLELLDDLRVLLVGLSLFRPGEDGEGQLPASEGSVLRGRDRALQHLLVRPDGIGVAQRSARHQENIKAPLKQRAGRLQLAAAGLQQHPVGRMTGQGAVVVLQLFFGPVPGVRQAQEELAELLRHVHDVLRRIALVQQVLLVGGMLRDLPEGVLVGPALEPVQLAFFSDGGHGVRPQGLEMLPDHPLAEGVQGRDLGGVDPQTLAVHVGVAALLFQGRSDPLPHFRGRRPGKGDDQHPGDVSALPDQPGHPLHQHGGFARPRRRADQHRLIVRLDGRRLFLRPVHMSSARSRDSLSNVSRETFRGPRKEF